MSWNVFVNFYYTDYDWGVVYRKIGDDVVSEESEFRLTSISLDEHMERNEEWTPRNESLSAAVGDLQPDSFYEVCLAVIDQVIDGDQRHVKGSDFEEAISFPVDGVLPAPK